MSSVAPGPPSLMAPAMPVSSSVTVVFVITDEPEGLRKTVARVPERNKSRRERLVVRQSGEAVRCVSRGHPPRMRAAEHVGEGPGGSP